MTFHSWLKRKTDEWAQHITQSLREGHIINKQHRQEGWLLPTERASVSAISLRHIIWLPHESHAGMSLPTVVRRMQDLAASRVWGTFWPPWVRPWEIRGKCYIDRKRIQCWSNASQHIPIYLQPFLKYGDISVASDWFSTVNEVNERFFYHILLSPGYAPGAIAVNVTRLKRGFNACKTPRCIISIYLQPFLRNSELLVKNCDIFIPHLCLAVS